MSATDVKDVSTSVVIENGFTGPIVGRFWGHIGDARDTVNPNPLQVVLLMRFIEVAAGFLAEMSGMTGVSFRQARVPCFQSTSGFQVCNQGNPRIRELRPIPAIISSNVIDRLLTRISIMTK